MSVKDEGILFNIQNIFPSSSSIPNDVINESEVEKKVCEIIRESETLEKHDKIDWLRKAISFIDLTTLNANDTATTVQTLCQKACNIEFSFSKDRVYPAAICVYPLRIKDALDALTPFQSEHEIKVASVAAGFPSGQYPLETRLLEIRLAIEYGAKEIDIVINRSLVITKEWDKLLDELKSMRKACKGVCMKTIIATGELLTLNNVYMASMIAMIAGSDFIKTSTGKETVNATLPVGVVMAKAIRDFYNKTERKVGFKPAGGIKTAEHALQWMTLIKTELGDEWLTKDLFRIGASSLLDNIIAEIEQMKKAS